MLKRSPSLALTCLALAAAPAPAAPPGPQIGDFGFDVSGMDRAVNPGDDFYAFANGAWDRRTEIPADQARWGAFSELAELAAARTHEVVEAAAHDPHASGPARKVGDMYSSFMDAALIEQKGLQPARPDLQRIAAVGTPSDLAALAGWFSRSGAYVQGGRVAVMAPIKVRVQVDDKNPDAYEVAIDQGDLGLPDRDYYLDAGNAGFAKARAAYQQHVERMLALAGVPDAAAKARAVMDLETAMARVMWSREQRRDRDKTYNPVAAADLPRQYPGFDWPRFLAAAQLGRQARVIVREPGAVQALAQLTRSTPLDTWRAYFTYSLLNARAQALPKAFVDEDFQLQAALSGVTVQRERWKRGVEFVSPTVSGEVLGLGDAVGQLYVARYFPPETKAKADQLVRNLLAAMRVRLQDLTWMAPETKARALQKLAAFRAKIGYPDRFIDYAGVQIRRDDAYGNLVRTVEAAYDRHSLRVDQPTDRGEWHMTPQTVNAYANPPWVEVVFPAAILQPPFFDPKADDAVNYGGIGAVIGHEISHHFDDQGSKYDAGGRLQTWWTPQDVARFKAYTDRVVAQYSAYEPLPGVHVKGQNTLGENMADLAGLNVARDAWLISLGGRPAPVLDGFTGEQRFFLGFAQVWRTRYREAALLRALASDEHTPGQFRPYVVRNLDAWYAAFDVQPGTKFYLAPADRIKVW